tara:strand:+ start:112 stop:309 length:198 start_codon:yes stop_codon:yes gene_type:complete
MSNKKIKKIFTSALFLPHLYYRIIPRKEKDMELNKTFKITFWAKKAQKTYNKKCKMDRPLSILYI